MQADKELRMHVAVVVVTALSLECRAVCADLSDLEEHVSESNIVFELGSLRTGSGGVRIAVAEVGAGNSNAGIETVEFHQTLWMRYHPFCW